MPAIVSIIDRETSAIDEKGDNYKSEVKCRKG
jgi:hypothetical protein